MASKSIKFRRKLFPTINALADYYNIASSTVAFRLRSGFTIEEAVGLKKRKRIGHGKSVIVEGKKYPTIKDACIAYNLDPKTIRARILNGGYSPEDAILGNLRGMQIHPQARSFVYKEKNYTTGTALAAEYGQRYSNLIRRVNRGWTLGQALLDEAPPPRFRNFEGHARNVNWKLIRETPEGLIEPIPDADGYKLYVIKNTKNKKEYIGITTNSLSSRLTGHFAASRKGRKAPLYNAIRKHGDKSFSINLIRSDAKSYAELQQQEVDEIAKRNSVKKGYNVALGGSLGTSKRIVIQEKTFPSQAAAAEFYGVEPYAFNLRLNRLKWTPEEAAGLIDRNWQGKSQSVTVKGKSYSSVRKAAEAHGKDYKKVYDRYGQKGWSLEQALDLAPPPNTVKYTGTSLIYKRKKFSSLAEFARVYNLNPDLIGRKLRQGLSLNEIMIWIKSNKRARKRDR